MAQVYSEDVLAHFVHDIRQPLSALEALASFLELITPPDDSRVQEQLRQIHVQIDQADRILTDGVRTIQLYLSDAARCGRAPTLPAAPPERVEELSRPLTRAAMASVTY